MEKSPYEIWVEEQLLHIENEGVRASVKGIIDIMIQQDEEAQVAGYVLGFVQRYYENGYDAVKALLNGMIEQQKAAGIEDEGQQKVTEQIYELIDAIETVNLDKDTVYKTIRLLKGKPIVQLTGAEDEWKVVMEEDDNGNPIETDLEQNKLCTAVFRKNKDNSTASYQDGKIFSEDGGRTWFGAHTEELKSTVPVTFPFWEPDHPEYIFLNGKDSTEILTDPEKIKELFTSSITVE